MKINGNNKDGGPSEASLAGSSHSRVCWGQGIRGDSRILVLLEVELASSLQVFYAPVR